MVLLFWAFPFQVGLIQEFRPVDSFASLLSLMRYGFKDSHFFRELLYYEQINLRFCPLLSFCGLFLHVRTAVCGIPFLVLGLLSVPHIALPIVLVFVADLCYRSSNAAAESFNAKIKAFRASLRGIVDEKFFLFRLAKIYAYPH